MIPDKDYRMYEAMRTFGGGFVQALAECLARADGGNYARLEAAFPDYFAEYRRLGQSEVN